MEVDEFGVAPPDGPGADVRLDFDAEDGVGFGGRSGFVRADVDGLEGGGGGSHWGRKVDGLLCYVWAELILWRDRISMDRG